jgi:hypothetical protein
VQERDASVLARWQRPLDRLGAYTLNSVTATRDQDGSVTVQFGGCDDQTTNCLPIYPNWNYMVRLYRPRQELLKGDWTFPKAEPG